MQVLGSRLKTCGLRNISNIRISNISDYSNSSNIDIPY